MFVSPPKNFNGIPMWTTSSRCPDPPMMPLPDFDMPEAKRQIRPQAQPEPQPQPQPMPDFPMSAEQFGIQPMPPIVNNPLYNQGWLSTQIGMYVKVEFLIGTGMWIDREGILKEVGISFIIIEETGSRDTIMCDIYSIKFVRVFRDQTICRK